MSTTEITNKELIRDLLEYALGDIGNAMAAVKMSEWCIMTCPPETHDALTKTLRSLKYFLDGADGAIQKYTEDLVYESLLPYDKEDEKECL